MKASILVITYNSASLISHFGNIIKDSIQCIEEVVVIDNASSDKTVDNIESLNGVNFPLKLVRNSKNEGYRKALNQGMALCKSKYVVSINLDIYFKKGSLCDLIELAPLNGNIRCVLPIVFQRDRKQPYVVSRETVPFLSIYNQVPKKINYSGQDNIATEICGGPCFLIDRDAFLTSGILSEEIPMYNEETEMSVKMRNAGYKFVVTEKLEIFHNWGSSTSDFSERNLRRDFFIKNWLVSTIRLYEMFSYHDGKLKKIIWKVLFLIKAFWYSLYQADSSYLFLAFGLVKSFNSVPTDFRLKSRWRILLFFGTEFADLIRVVSKSKITGG